MKHTSSEPDVLSVFRLFAALWLGLSLLGGSVLLASAAFSREAIIFYSASIVNAILLLGYLSWPRLIRLLGDKHLPGGVLIASAGPIIVTHLVLQLHTAETASIDTWPLAATLFVPLVIVAWRHSLYAVTVFCAGTALLDLFLTLLAAGGDGLYFFSSGLTILTRTISFFLVGYMVARIMRIQRQQRQALADANTKLVHYAATLDQLATTRERNRLARELHDTLAHTLSAVAIELEAVSALWDDNPDQARNLLTRSLAATRTGLTETRRALQALRSSPLEDLGLALAIRQEAESVTARANLALGLQVPDHLDNLPPGVEQCVYRIAQEALANVAHHARARHVAISLSQMQGCLTLSVSDDGCGFDLDTVDVENRLGLRGMHERAEMVGGTLEIDSGPGRGTTVRLVMEAES